MRKATLGAAIFAAIPHNRTAQAADLPLSPYTVKKPPNVCQLAVALVLAL